MKKTLSATVDIELIKWIKKKVSKERKYRNKSHLVEIALEKMKEEEE
jgi:Arc/MetJ-type ribon-helix-helix transcriptional regulator